MKRYAILHGEHTVWEVQISRPDGVEVDRPVSLRWHKRSADVKVPKMPAWNDRGLLTPDRKNAVEAAKVRWRRAGRVEAAA